MHLCLCFPYVKSLSSEMTSQRFAAQIKKLEEEGAKLLTATHNLGDSLNLSDHFNGKTTTAGNTSLNLSALTDISAEQKTISDLRTQLDSQCKETERLHREMFDNSGSAGREPALPSTLNHLEIPISHPLPPSAQLRKSFNSDYQTHVSERQLKDSQNEVKEMRSRLKEAISISEQQKSHFRSTIEDLREQLQNAVSGRESLLTRSQRELSEKDMMVVRLQETVEQLERANKQQEQTLLEMNERLESLQKDKYIIDTSVAQIRDVLVGRESKRGRVFYENEPIQRQSITMLIHSIERAFNDVDYDVNQRQDKLDQLILELDELKLRQERKEDQIIMQYERKMSKQRDEYNADLGNVTEQLKTYKEQNVTLKDKCTMLERDLHSQVTHRDEQISDLGGKVRLIKHEHDIDTTTWSDKRLALEQALNETEKELAIMRGDRDSSIRRTAQVESRFTDMQMAIDKLGAEFQAEQEKCRALYESELKAKANEERTHMQLKHKSEVLTELEHKCKAVKQEADTHIQTTINSMEKEGRAFIEKEMTSLKTQLQTMTETCHSQQLQLEVTKSDHSHLQEKYSDTRSSLEKVTSQLSEANTKLQSLTTMITEKVTELERTGRDREHLQQLYNARGEEMTSLRSAREKLSIQLEEREKNFLQLQQQHDRMAEVMETSTRSNTNYKEERDALQQRFNEKIIETEELRKMRDTIAKKLRIREKRLLELEEENKLMAEDIGETKGQAETLEKEQDKLLDELKQSRYEVAALEQEKSNLEKALEQNEGAMSKEMLKMNKRLKYSEHDLKLTKKVLKSKEHVDNKAVHIAGHMQKEVTAKRGQIDTLQSKINWLEECLEAALKDKKYLIESSETLAESIERRKQENAKLGLELKNSANRGTDFKQKVSKLEGALERAAVKNGHLETQLEQHEQDLVRMKLKHQLEIKELQRNSRNKHYPSHSIQSSPLLTGQQQQLTTTANQSPLAASQPLTQSCALTASRVTAPYTGALQYQYVAEKPVRDSKAAATSQETFAAAVSGGDTQELRDLMHEMRSVLQSHKQHTHATHLTDSLAHSDSELMPRLVRKNSARGRRDKRRSKKDTLLSSYTSQRSASPVSDLLLTFDEIQSDSCLPSGDDSYCGASNVHLYKSYRDISSQGIKKASNIAPAAQDVCKRLEKKIESLSKMGSHLQHEHKEMARVMQDQDRKLKNVRNQIR